MKIQKLLLALLLITGLGAGAQKLSVDKVYKVSLRNSGSIIENNQIKGYYFFYMSDKIDRKTNEYTLQIVDENLNKIKDIKFQDSKNVYLLESSFNGGSVAFSFFNDDQNSVDVRLYGMDGKQKFTYSKILDKKSEQYFKYQIKQMESEETENQSIYDIPGKGYVSVTPIRENKAYTYEVNFYASEKRRTWNFNPVEDGKFTHATFLGNNDSIMILEVLSKEKLMSKTMDSKMVGISLETGKKVFEVRTQNAGKTLYPMNISMVQGNNSQFLVLGTYYSGTDRIMADETEGLGIWLMNNQGKIEKSKYLSWAKDLAKYFKVDEKGRVQDLGWMYFHKLIQTSDGKIFAVGEGYKKVADGLGIAMNVLAGGYAAGVTKLKITNMLMLELNNAFELKSAKIYEKGSNSFSLGTGSDVNSPHILAAAAKNFGAFDYNFTQMALGSEGFTTAYSDYERTKDYKGKIFKTISYFDGKFVEDKLQLETKGSDIKVFPAKQGFMMVMEYIKKEKRLDMRLEKVNY